MATLGSEGVSGSSVLLDGDVYVSSPVLGSNPIVMGRWAQLHGWYILRSTAQLAGMG